MLGMVTYVKCLNFKTRATLKDRDMSDLFEIIHLCDEMININIWVPLSLSHNFLYVSHKLFTNGCCSAP